jgi:hypothetical protein
LNTTVPLTTFWNVFYLTKEVKTKLLVVVAIPSFAFTTIFVGGTAVVDQGFYLFFYYLAPWSYVLAGIPTVLFGSAIVKKWLKEHMQMEASRLMNFSPTFLLPSLVTFIFLVVYGLVLSRVFFDAPTWMKVILRVVIHPILVELAGWLLRAVTFRIRFAYGDNIGLLLVPFQFVAAFYGRLWIFASADNTQGADTLFGENSTSLVLTVVVSIVNIALRIGRFKLKNIVNLCKKNQVDVEFQGRMDPTAQISMDEKRARAALGGSPEQLRNINKASEMVIEYIAIMVPPVIILVYWKVNLVISLLYYGTINEHGFVSPPSAEYLMVLTMIQVVLEVGSNIVYLAVDEKVFLSGFVKSQRPEQRRKTIVGALLLYVQVVFVIVVTFTSAPVFAYCSGWDSCLCGGASLYATHEADMCRGVDFSKESGV